MNDAPLFDGPQEDDWDFPDHNVEPDVADLEGDNQSELPENVREILAGQHAEHEAKLREIRAAQVAPVVLRDYQREAIDGVFRAWEGTAQEDPARSTLLVLPTGCHAPGTPILMHDGTTTAVEDVRVGDELMGPDSRPRKVMQLAHGHDSMFRIVPVKGESWTVNAGHILTLVRTNEKKVPHYPCQKRGGEIIDVPLREYLTWSKWRKHLHKLIRVGVDFDPKHQEPWYGRVHLDPYCLGVLIGDGSFRDNLSITSADSEVIAAISVFLSARGLVLKKVDDYCHLFKAETKWGRGKQEFRKWLSLLGLNRKLSGDKFVPRPYMISPRADRLAMLAGLMDSDGHATCGGYDYISKSKQLAEDVAFLSRSVGLAAYIRPCEKRSQNGNGGTYWRVSISGDTSIVPCLTPRKQNKPRRQIKDALRTGFRVQPAGSGEYYGFSLDGDGRFLLGDFTVTHNTGKTIALCGVIDRLRREGVEGRVMMLAHREELIFQGAKRWKEFSGEDADIEMADLHATANGFGWANHVVVSSVQTQNAGRNVRRMEAFPPADFGLLILDEAHHATADTYRRVIEYYGQNPNLRILGCTATPDRADEEALGQIFDSVAYDYEITDAIRDGWLVPVTAQAVTVEGLDFSSMRTTAGDLNGADLASVMEEEEPLHGIAGPTLEIIGDRKTLVFASSVRHAELLADIFNRHRAGMARFVCGKTEKDERRAMLRAYHDGDFQILVNVGVATEGFDEPGIAVVVMARPTKSRSLYAQMAGRGTRPLPGIVDGLDDATARRESIASSDKPTCELVDFVGVCGRHRLISSADILGGNYSDREIEIAAAAVAAANAPVDVADELEKAKAEAERERERERQKRMKVKVKAKYASAAVEVFDVLDIQPAVARGWDRVKKLSAKQKAFLEKRGIDPESVTFTQAKQLIGTMIERMDKKLCSYKQAKLLNKYGYDGKNITFDRARELIDAIAANGWRRPG